MTTHQIEQNYWLTKLSGERVKSYFPYDERKEGASQLTVYPFELPVELASRLVQVSNGSDQRLFMVLAAGLKALLYKYTGSTEVTFRAPIYKQEMAGDFINTVLVLSSKIDGNYGFKDVLLQVREVVTGAVQHQNYSLKKIIQQLNLTEDEGFPFSDITLLLENIHEEKYLGEIATNLTFYFAHTGEKLTGRVKYNPALYRQSTVERLIANLQVFFTVALASPALPIGEIEVLTGEEKERILHDFNDFKLDFPANKTVAELIETEAAKNPGKTAVVDKERQITYGELDTRANCLASFLQSKGVKANNVVGLMTDRSVEMIVGMVGILKAGGAYLPIDPAYPYNRVRAMLKDSGAVLLLTKEGIIGDAWRESRSEEDCMPVFTAKRPQIKDLDNLPIPDRTLIDYDRYNQYIGHAKVKNAIAIQATRGCPYNCAYCHKIWPKSHIVRSAENIFDEIMLYYNIGVRRFAFVDDIFNLDKENSIRFFKLVIANGLDIQLFFTNGLRGDILTPEYIDLMAEAGTINITVSLETASPRLQKLIGKNLNVARLKENLQYIFHRHPQIVVHLNSIHGFPTETEEEARMTLDFIKSLKWIHFPYVHILKIYPNTDMEKIALENGISREAIERSAALAFHEIPETVPFSKSFTRQYQAEFLNDYFLRRERLLHVLPLQMRAFTESELVDRYNSYLPGEINTFDQLLDFVKISRAELGDFQFRQDESFAVKDFNASLRKHRPEHKADADALRVLLLDLSLHFSEGKDVVYDIVEPPLGLMYVQTYLNQKFGPKVVGKIAKARIDFDSFAELKTLLDEWQPDLIGIRSLTYYRDFCHETAAYIRQWGIKVPMIAGGPYASSSPKAILSDPNFDLVVLGEGEETFSELVELVLKNGKQWPAETKLQQIMSIAYLPEKERAKLALGVEIFGLNQLSLPEAGFAENLSVINPPQNLAYVLFTSGSTGKPKGVMIDHRSITNLAAGLEKKIFAQYGPDLKVALVAPYVFDASVQQIFTTLIYGHTLYIVPDEVKRDGVKFLKYYEENAIDISDGTPALLNILLNSAAHAEISLPVKHFLIGGEALPAKTVEKFAHRFKEARVINVYGPTECCVDATAYEIKPGEVFDSAVISIGTPLYNRRVYILSQKKELLPIGAIGEIYIGGEGIGQGYIGQPELTLERFAADPYNPGGRMYKTGDLGRWKEDGNIEFIGRIDHQVKVRGYRIELGEIENQLLAHPKVQEAVVIVREDRVGDKYLCAYIVTKAPFSPGELKEFLGKELPDYMIPAYFVKLEKMPLTVNNKVDKGALPNPQDETGIGSTYVAPRNEVEARLVEAWQEVLGLAQVSITDNFFELGGDSIKAILISAYLQRFGLKCEMIQLFQTPTIAELSQFVSTGTKKIDQSAVSGNVELTAVQRWFFAQNFQQPHCWNQSVQMFKQDGFEAARVKKVLEKLAEHHDALRMVFRQEGAEVVQFNREIAGELFTLQVCDFTAVKDPNLAMVEEMAELQHSMDLSQGPLCKAGLFKTGIGDYLFLTIHHLLTDGISWRIILEDFITGYGQLTTGVEVVFPPKTDSFKTWAKEVKEYAYGAKLTRELPYWKKIAASELAALPKAAADNHAHGFASVSAALSAGETGNLLKKANQAYSTEINDLLLTALSRTVFEWAGISRVAVTLEGHGREGILDGLDISRTVGWFTSLYPVILDLGSETDLAVQIKYIKENLRTVPEKGVGYGILKYLTSPDYEANLPGFQPEISFNYLGQFAAEKDKEISIVKMPYLVKADDKNVHHLHFLSQVVEKKLTIELQYRVGMFTEKTAGELLQIYKKNLLQVITHCISTDKVEVTPSDLTFNELSIAELDEIAAMLNLED